MKKLTIEEMRAIAERHGGECLSETYIDNKTKLTWKCSNNHIWEAQPSGIKSGQWCPYCYGNVKLTIEEMQGIAKSRGGKCLSKRYVSNYSKLHWECNKGHRWGAVPTHIKNGEWCPYCNGHKKLTIQEMRTIAKRKGGLCLSKKYVNSQTNLRWRCKEGHEWNGLPNNVKRGEWCPFCAGNVRLNIEILQARAKAKGGKCLSKKYVNAKTPILWECALGHKWKVASINVRKGTWCPICSIQIRSSKRKLTIEKMGLLARAKGGICLSDIYVNSHTTLRWKCKEGHEWEAAADNIQHGTWCPYCSKGVTERICRKLFEYIFNEEFPKKKPSWLVNSRGSKMELDGYCEKLGLAFEYQGEQHYGPHRMFQRTRGFKRQFEDDALKRKLCRLHKVILIGIPYTIPNDDKLQYIKKACERAGVRLPARSKDVDYRSLDVYSPQKIIEMQNLAKQQGGKCLSNYYINKETKLRWQCKKGHEWEATPGSIKHGTWCPYCGKETSITKRRLTIQAMQEMAGKKGGQCLSDTYKNNRTKLRWQCKKLHVWEATPEQIGRGQWCPICAHRVKLTIGEMQELAELKGGKCLSKRYVNNQSTLIWQCTRRHVWKAIPESIKRGSWCPFCYGHRKLTIEEMKKLAKAKGGKCLSKQYVNSETVLQWRCKKGHVWRAIPDSIKRGSWCPNCFGKNKTIKDMQKIAENRGGKCLSLVYKNNRTKLDWQCKEGHHWQADPAHILRGQWCPICAGKRKTNSR